VKPVVYTKLAEREIEAAAVFFEGRKEGLGEPSSMNGLTKPKGRSS